MLPFHPSFPEVINRAVESQSFSVNPWIDRLLQNEQLEHLDRETVVEMISMIYIYENNSIILRYTKKYKHNLHAALSSFLS